jgi:choline dehydrogenase-like flavoprotein
MNDSPRYCVVGSGATGCLCGEKLAQAGYDVTLLDIDVAIVFVDSNRTGEAGEHRSLVAAAGWRGAARTARRLRCA